MNEQLENLRSATAALVNLDNAVLRFDGGRTFGNNFEGRLGSSPPQALIRFVTNVREGDSGGNLRRYVSKVRPSETLS
jgi:hypothetical protein